MTSFLSVTFRAEETEGGAGLCSLVTNNSMHSNGTKLHQKRFRLGIREDSFTTRMARHWNKLPSEELDTSCLSAFKKHLDNALNDVL